MSFSEDFDDEDEFRQYFYIRSEMHGKVLEAGLKGHKLVVNMRLTPPVDSQLWYEDEDDNIMSKTGLAIDSTDLKFVRVQQPFHEKVAQQWKREGQCIVNKHLPGKCIDIIQKKRADHIEICVFKYRSQSNQHWCFDMLDDPLLPVYGHVTSKMHGKVLSIATGNRLVMEALQNPPVDEQLWYTDQTGVLHSKIHDLAIDGQDEDCIRVKEYNTSDPNQQWELQNDVILNRCFTKKCLDIAKKNKADGAELCAYTYKSQLNQQWIFTAAKSSGNGVSPTAAKTDSDYFYMSSLMNGKVITIDPSSRMLTMEPLQQPPPPEQQWYEDDVHVIRSRVGDAAINVPEESSVPRAEGPLTAASYDMYDSNQQWIRQSAKNGYFYIVKRDQRKKCLDIARKNTADGAVLCSFPYKGQVNQIWDCRNLNSCREFFTIGSRMHGKLLEVDASSMKAVMVTKPVHISDLLLWYKDTAGIVHSKMSDLVFDSTDPMSISMHRHDPTNPDQQWIISPCDCYIINLTDRKMCLDITKKSKEDFAGICAFKNKGQSNQTWSFVTYD